MSSVLDNQDPSQDNDNKGCFFVQPILNRISSKCVHQGEPQSAPPRLHPTPRYPPLPLAVRLSALWILVVSSAAFRMASISQRTFFAAS